MQIMGFDGAYAVCERDGQQYLIDTQLVGTLETGAWLLTFLDTAREVLSSEQAGLINNALQALALTQQGETDIGHLFADLIDREPYNPFLSEHS